MAIHQAYQELRYERPAIRIQYSESVPAGQFAEVLLGIEEEGLPYSVEALPETNGLKLAYEASHTNSRLGIGIGIGTNGMFLHYEKLKENEPLFELPLDATDESKRALGANAARLTKKLPFKTL